jgi:hypothetical protein
MIALQFESKCRARPLMRIGGYTDKLTQDPVGIGQHDATWRVFLVRLRSSAHSASEPAARPLARVGF